METQRGTSMQINGCTLRRDGTILGVKGRALKPYLNKDGYHSVTVAGKKTKVHRLLAEAFIPNPENKPEVNHIDGDKTNNAVTNLEWATASENRQHAYDTGLRGRAVDRVLAKLSEDDVRAIRSAYLDKYNGWGRAMARKYGVSATVISYIVNWKTYKHVR